VAAGLSYPPPAAQSRLTVILKSTHLTQVQTLLSAPAELSARFYKLLVAAALAGLAAGVVVRAVIEHSAVLLSRLVLLALLLAAAALTVSVLPQTAATAPLTVTPQRAVVLVNQTTTEVTVAQAVAQEALVLEPLLEAPAFLVKAMLVATLRKEVLTQAAAVAVLLLLAALE
jgi:hypothetical protein